MFRRGLYLAMDARGDTPMLRRGSPVLRTLRHQPTRGRCPLELACLIGDRAAHRSSDQRGAVWCRDAGMEGEVGTAAIHAVDDETTSAHRDALHSEARHALRNRCWIMVTFRRSTGFSLAWTATRSRCARVSPAGGLLPDKERLEVLGMAG